MKNFIVMLLVAFLAMVNTARLYATENQTLTELCFDIKAPPAFLVSSKAVVIESQASTYQLIEAGSIEQINSECKYVAQCINIEEFNEGSIVLVRRRGSHTGKLFTDVNYNLYKTNPDDTVNRFIYKKRLTNKYEIAYSMRDWRFNKE